MRVRDISFVLYLLLNWMWMWNIRTFHLTFHKRVINIDLLPSVFILFFRLIFEQRTQQRLARYSPHHTHVIGNENNWLIDQDVTPQFDIRFFYYYDKCNNSFCLVAGGPTSNRRNRNLFKVWERTFDYNRRRRHIIFGALLTYERKKFYLHFGNIIWE